MQQECLFFERDRKSSFVITELYFIFVFDSISEIPFWFSSWAKDLYQFGCGSHKTAGPWNHLEMSRKNFNCHSSRNVISWIVLWYDVTSLVCTVVLLNYLHSVCCKCLLLCNYWQYIPEQLCYLSRYILSIIPTLTLFESMCNVDVRIHPPVPGKCFLHNLT